MYSDICGRHTGWQQQALHSNTNANHHYFWLHLVHSPSAKATGVVHKGMPQLMQQLP
jgi:hypothetical protein